LRQNGMMRFRREKYILKVPGGRRRREPPKPDTLLKEGRGVLLEESVERSLREDALHRRPTFW